MSKVNYVLIMFVSYCLFPINLFAKVDVEYGIITGERVNIRKSPNLKSKVLRQSLKNELVFYLGKTKKKYNINKDNNYWINIKMQDKRNGWVYGKYFYYLNQKKYPEKYYVKIIQDELIPTGRISLKYHQYNCVYNVSFKTINDKYIVFSYKSIDNVVIFGWQLIYKYNSKQIKLLVFDSNSKYYIYNEYILTKSKYGINIYDSKKFVNSSYVFRKDKIYKCIVTLHLRDLIGLPYYGSHIDFDEKTKIASVHIQRKKKGPFIIEKYKFDDGKFVKVK